MLSRALAVGEPLVAALREHPAAIDVELAGSARRMTDTVKDLDVIATATDPLALARAAAELDLIEDAGTPTDGRRAAAHAHGHRGSTCGSSSPTSSATCSST